MQEESYQTYSDQTSFENSNEFLANDPKHDDNAQTNENSSHFTKRSLQDEDFEDFEDFDEEDFFDENEEEFAEDGDSQNSSPNSRKNANKNNCIAWNGIWIEIIVILLAFPVSIAFLAILTLIFSRSKVAYDSNTSQNGNIATGGDEDRNEKNLEMSDADIEIDMNAHRNNTYS